MSLATPELAGRAAEDFSTALDNVFNDEVLWDLSQPRCVPTSPTSSDLSTNKTRRGHKAVLDSIPPPSHFSHRELP
jgi:hypothetical protein